MQKAALSLFLIFKIVCSCAKRCGKQYLKNLVSMIMDFMQDNIFPTRSDLQRWYSTSNTYVKLSCLYEKHTDNQPCS